MQSLQLDPCSLERRPPHRGRGTDRSRDAYAPVARRSGKEQRIQTLNQSRHLVFCAPEPIRVRVKDRPKNRLVTRQQPCDPGRVPTVSETKDCGLTYVGSHSSPPHQAW
jgi:hypothetical protein